MQVPVFSGISSPGLFPKKKWEGREKALASAGHMTKKTPRNCGCNKLAGFDKFKMVAMNGETRMTANI